MRRAEADLAGLFHRHGKASNVEAEVVADLVPILRSIATHALGSSVVQEVLGEIEAFAAKHGPALPPAPLSAEEQAQLDALEARKAATSGTDAPPSE